ncbi:hypothetical protein ET464_18580 [Paenibacillus protaetiae]|uniref:PKD domain-containing protein n=2 Tax=Paenibacillus protaetiae TaxID=2509456 RepID=A0A4P6EZ77_9BACL|nr:hypothetical protein ET464_18580 [Paenibacillus protaetiae]
MLTATLRNKGSKTIKDWTLYGRANDGSQLQTITSTAPGQETATYKFRFTIAKEKLNNVDSYTETWVMRARVNFTDGTSAESVLECTTLVTKGAPPASGPDSTPAPTPEPIPIPEADIQFNPDTIVTGEQSSLQNRSQNYDDFEWTFSDNLSEVFTDTSRTSYPNKTFTKPGIYQATITVWNGLNKKVSDTATLYVVDPKPVAIITGPSCIIEGRPFDAAYHLLNSYTPLASRGVTINFSRSETRYKKIGDTDYTPGWPTGEGMELGTYEIEGKVYDSQGRESDWASMTLEVVPDQAPTVSLVTPEEAYRGNDVQLYLEGKSPDGDAIVHAVIEERYDADNDGNFEEESWKTLYDGDYKQWVPVTYSTVGKRQYRAKVKEDWGLESAWSGLEQTTILNYAPNMDFNVYGLTSQPNEDSQPPELSYTSKSVYHSWTLKTPYQSDSTASLNLWKADDSFLSTKATQMMKFSNDYPNMGLGPNARSPYKLASDLTAAPPYLAPSGLVYKIFAGNRMYALNQGTYNAADKTYTFTVNELNSLNGSLLRTFTITGTGQFGNDDSSKHFNEGMMDAEENFYFHRITDDRNLLIDKFDNEGNHRDTYTIPLDSTLKDAVFSHSELSPDEQYMYVFVRYYKTDPSIFQEQVIKYAMQQRTVVYSVPVGDLFKDSLLDDIKVTHVGDGTIYFSFRTQGYYSDAHDQQVTFARISPAGVTGYLNRSAEYASPIVLSEDGKRAYVTIGDTTSTSMTTSFSTFVSSNWASVNSYKIDWRNDSQFGVPSSDAMNKPNPVVLPNGDVQDLLLFTKDGALKNKNNLSTYGFSKLMMDAGGNLIGIKSDGAKVNGSYQTGVTVASNTQSVVWVQEPVIDRYNYFSDSYTSNIQPDGSIYAFNSIDLKEYVYPFYSPSAAGGIVNPIDDNTVEVSKKDWSGLWYDPNTKVKNYTFSFNTAIGDLKNNGIVGAAFQIKDPENMYSVEWSNDTLTLYKVVNGTKTVMKSAAVARSAGVTYPMEVESINGNLRVSINHVKQLEGYDETFTSGSFGIMAIGQPQAKFSGIHLKNYGDTYIEETAQTVLVGEEIKYDKLFSDLENDPEAAERWSYSHDPNYFANPEGPSEVDGKTFDETVKSLDKPGLYKITATAEDDPGLPNYQKWSEPVTKELYVHRRPIAQPDVRLTDKVYEDGTALDYTTYDTSYDPDVPDYLAQRVFRTRWADESTWTMGQRYLYDRPGVELIIQEQVKDVHGAWSYWGETRVYEDALPPANQTKPVMTITVPGGTETNPYVYATTQTPTIYWKYFDAENDPQEQFYLKLVYADTGDTITEVSYPGDDYFFRLQDGILEPGRKVKVFGRVYSNGVWSDDSNETYLIVNTPPKTKLLSFNGPTALAPIYTNNNKPELKVQVTDAENQTTKFVDYEITKVSTSQIVVDTNTATSSMAYIPAGLADGLYSWKARANDGLDWGDYSETGYFFVDTVRPDDTDEKLTISPTSVTVKFNPFSDADPSSGHATRGFYMQQVNDDGSVTAIDLNGNGTVEESVPLDKNALTYTVSGLKTGQQYRLMVVDWDAAGNMGQYAYIYFNTNRPPIADFDWSPKPVYEGDAVQFASSAADPDADPLTAVYKLTRPDGTTASYGYSLTAPYEPAGPSVRMDTPGMWRMALSVSDGIETVETVKTIAVLPLSVTGYVKHTEEWDKRRKSYNQKQSGDDNLPGLPLPFGQGRSLYCRQTRH